jgi:hypothetical protein
MPYRIYRLINGALAGSCFVAVTQIITKDNVSDCLYAATICFAVAIPGLACYFLYPPTFQRERKDWSRTYSLYHLLYLFVASLSLIGFALLFFSIGVVPGVLSVAAIVVSVRLLNIASAHSHPTTGFK